MCKDDRDWPRLSLAGRERPLAHRAFDYASIEGNDNFSEEFTYNLQAMMARSVTKYAHVFFSPAAHFNANGQRRFDPRASNFFRRRPSRRV